MDSNELIYRYLNGEADAEEVARLDGLLASDPELRRRLIEEARMDAGLREVALERTAAAEMDSGAENVVALRSAVSEPWQRWGGWAAAALLLVGIGFGVLRDPQPASVATLISSEDAAWESALPTLAGSELSPGRLNLKSGMATIQFHSGAEAVLTAPAELELQSSKRGRIHHGAAVVAVPDNAVGFVMETPGGYAEEHGNRFAVTVDRETTEASFAVLAGEISVHHAETGTALRLKQDQKSTLTRGGLKRATERSGAAPKRRSRNSKRIRTQGYATAIARPGGEGLLNPDLLLVSATDEEPDREYRSLFGFQVGAAEREAAQNARIRFYVVPSQEGFAAHLPKRNRFAVYGVSQEAVERFSLETQWDTAPQLEDAVKLGTFEIPRSKQRGVVWFRSDAIVDFVRSDTNGLVTFIIVRETTETERHGMVHAFASDSHPDGAGPVLELVFDSDTAQNLVAFHPITQP